MKALGYGDIIEHSELAFLEDCETLDFNTSNDSFNRPDALERNSKGGKRKAFSNFYKREIFYDSE
jgi:hypothetical protein